MLKEFVVLHYDGTQERKVIDYVEPPPTPEPEPAPTLEERVGSLEKSKANQADVDELNEALNMILTGATQ